VFAGSEIRVKLVGRRIPLALFTYNRPAHTAATLKALSACKGRESFTFFFFSDAPRHSEDRESVEAVRRLLRDQAPLFDAEVIEQSTNQGLARSIVGGVDRLCASHGWVVVLEDDLLVEPSFLEFMAEALVYYEHRSTVMQVGATTLAPPQRQTSGAFLLPVTSTWGWGTWQRAWKSFSWTPQGWPQCADDADWLSVFQLGGAADYVAMLEDRLAGRNDSWGILWWYAVSRARGKVVYPSRSLVRNIGFDGTGVHCGKESLFEFPQHSRSDDLDWSAGGANFPNEDDVYSADYQLLQSILSGKSTPVSSWKLRWKNILSVLKGRINHGLA
jgi:GT2 family glycosyltransferase